MAILVNRVGFGRGLSHVQEIVTVINALAMFIATCIGSSQVKAFIGK